MLNMNFWKETDKMFYNLDKNFGTSKRGKMGKKNWNGGNIDKY